MAGRMAYRWPVAGVAWVVCVLQTLGAWAGASEAVSPATPAGLSVPALVQKVAPSVVLVRVLNGQEQLLGTGSGFVVAPGVVAMCYHVVASGAAATVRTADRIEYPVTEVIATDRQLDLALVRVLKFYDVPPLEVRSLASIRVGEPAIAVGSPRGLEGSVTTGVVSAIRELGNLGTVIQTSAPISPGNSGGPLLDAQGRVMGVVQSIRTDAQNVNFAIPAHRLLELMRRPASPTPLGAAAASGAKSDAGPELLARSGVLEPRTRTVQVRIPAKEPFSVRLPAHQYTNASLSVSANGKPLQRVKGQDGITPATFWVSELGSLWVDKTYARREISVTLEYRPVRVAVCTLDSEYSEEVQGVLADRVNALGDEPVTGADAAAALAKVNASTEEEGIREIGRKLNCAYLAAATLATRRRTKDKHFDVETVRVGLAVIDLNSGAIVGSATRETSFTIGQYNSDRRARRAKASDLIAEMLSEFIASGSGS